MGDFHCGVYIPVNLKNSFSPLFFYEVRSRLLRLTSELRSSHPTAALARSVRSIHTLKAHIDSIKFNIVKKRWIK